MWHVGWMAQEVCPIVSGEDRARLEAIVADRNRAHKHVLRARIILHSAESLRVAEVARRVGVGRPAVWRWQRRFALAGVDGLLRDATRKPGKAPLDHALVRRVVALTCTEPPGEATHWTGRAMAQEAGISLRSVQRIWMAHALQPHRTRTFKRSNDPEFAAKLEAIVGLYLDPLWEPGWPSTLLDWPDFGVPKETGAADAEIRAAFERARTGEQVEVACVGGHGRTGTVLACMAVLAGVPGDRAVEWVRARYCVRAVQEPSQQYWVERFAERACAPS